VNILTPSYVKAVNSGASKIPKGLEESEKRLKDFSNKVAISKEKYNKERDQQQFDFVDFNRASLEYFTLYKHEKT
jgi:hypothetical protein